MAGPRGVRKNKRNLIIKDIRPLDIYYLINKPRSLDMKNYLVTGGLSSVTKPFNNVVYSKTTESTPT